MTIRVPHNIVRVTKRDYTEDLDGYWVEIYETYMQSRQVRLEGGHLKQI